MLEPVEPAADLVEVVARDIADALGDNFNYAFSGKAEWIAERGETPAGYRDVNQPYKPDYLDAAIAAITALGLHITARERATRDAALDEAARYIQDNHPFDKRALVPAILALKEKQS